MINRLWRNIRRFKKPRFPNKLILLYHSIAEVNTDPWSLVVTPKHLAEQLEILRKQYRIIRLEELAQDYLNGRIHDCSVAITFDDGYANNLYNAKPLLERFDMPATMFLTSEYVGKDHEFWWDELDRILLQGGPLPESLKITINGTSYNWNINQAADNSAGESPFQRVWRAWENLPTPRHLVYLKLWEIIKTLQYEEQLSVLNYLRIWASLPQLCRSTHRTLSHEEAIKLAEGDLIEIGCHTKTHPVLSTISAEFQRDEIISSKNDLQELLGMPVTSFSYPYGTENDYNDITVSIVKEAGFKCAFSNNTKIVKQDPDLFQLPRTNVEDWNGEEFARQISVWIKA